MLKILPIIPSSTSQKLHIFILTYIITHHAHIILYALLFHVLHPEKHKLYTYFVVVIL